jgi:hypothetical protein
VVARVGRGALLPGHKDGAGSMVMTLGVTLRSTMPSSLDLPCCHDDQGGGAWWLHVKSDVLLLGARCLSRWPASASYSQP